MPGFMVGGAEAYEKALRQDYESSRERLQARLKKCDDPLEQQAIGKELQELQKDFKSALRKLRHCLFGTP